MDGPLHEWNLADLLGVIARHRGDHAMIVEPGRTLSWSDVDRRTTGLAATLVRAGLRRGDRVGVCARNAAAVLETYLACCKASLVPFNINFRYSADEIAYLLDNADARAVVAHQEFASSVGAAATATAPGLVVVQVADDSGAPGCPEATDYEAAVVMPAEAVEQAAWERSPDDLVFLYTGGTTGMPKAVMWRQGDLVTLLAGTDAPPGDDRSGVGADVVGRLAPRPRRSCTAAPMVHGTGLLSQIANFMTGGTSVIVGGRSFDPHRVWRTVADEQVEVLVIVGDPFARPLLDALDADPGLVGRLGSLRMITSSGAMLSRQVKAALLERLPELAILDAFGSSEASGLGVALASADDIDGTAEFRAGPRVRVLGDDGGWVEPGSGRSGRIAITGPIPLGYHKDPAKTAETYPVIDGVRYSVPGDHVIVHADGRMTLLGRGSSVINTGGEKVHPEEVEERLKEHPEVEDAACVGLDDPRFGHVVGAVVQARGGVRPDPAVLRAFVRERLAPYKVPRRIVLVDDLRRHPNGKLDRRAVAAMAADAEPSA